MNSISPLSPCPPQRMDNANHAFNNNTNSHVNVNVNRASLSTSTSVMNHTATTATANGTPTTTPNHATTTAAVSPKSSALDHLVEAATALTQLVRTASVQRTPLDANSSSGSSGSCSSAAANVTVHVSSSGTESNTRSSLEMGKTSTHEISDDDVDMGLSSVTGTGSANANAGTVRANANTNAGTCYTRPFPPPPTPNNHGVGVGISCSSGLPSPLTSNLIGGSVTPTTGMAAPFGHGHGHGIPPPTSNPAVAVPVAALTPNAKEIFPRRLFRMLSDPTISDIITWLPHGRAFVIMKTEALADTVLPTYFPESCAPPPGTSTKVLTNTSSGSKKKCKYPSFTRKLNRWGFRQITRGHDSGAFHHNFFIREDPDLCLKMVCQRIKRGSSGGGGGGKRDKNGLRVGSLSSSSVSSSRTLVLVLVLALLHRLSV